MFTVRLARVVLLAIIVAPHCAKSQIKPGDWMISPWLQNLVVGETGRVQVLDDQWEEVAGVQWSVSDTKLAQILPDEVDKSIATIRPLAAGQVVVTATVNGLGHSMTVNLWNEHLPPDHHQQWGAIGFGKNINHVKARQLGSGEPALYLASLAGSITVIHALDEDGIQKWKWVVPESEGNAAKLRAGDDNGGALVSVQRAHDYILYSLSAAGELRWSYFGRDKLQSHALGFDNLYLIEAAAGHPQVRFVAVDVQHGKEQFRYPVPQSLVTRINIASETLSCLPNLHAQVPQAIMFSRLLVNTDGNVYFAFVQDRLILQARHCTSETAFLNGTTGLVHYDNSIFLWKVSPNGDLVSTLVQRDQGESAPSHGFTPLMLPTGDITPDGAGGVLISVRHLPGGTRSSPDFRRDYIYRITQAGNLAYKFALPPIAELRIDDGVALNDEDRAFTTVGGIVLCFDSLSGQEVWRYDTGTPKVAIIFAKQDGGVVVQDGNLHMLAVDKNGKKTADEDFNPAHQLQPPLPD